ncbi:MAG: efflux RND transporter periplasmic adaptor subunit [Zoogloeaceae bacterium]|jgi:RND family efflux transporter MFP subunit|nr:efflux RND transporter periplasmic adaptor subunit [Zoogloeaceae bacterium]
MAAQRKKRLSAGVSVWGRIGALALLAGCSAEPPPLPPRPVLVLTVGAENGAGGSAFEAQRYSAVIRSRTEAPLAFQVGGKMLERRVDVGSMVEKGQVLARLDAADTALRLTAAEAELALAEAEAARYRALRAKNFVSQTALDAKESALKTIRAQTQLAQNQRRYTDLIADQSGVIARVEAEPGQVVAPGQTVLWLARPDLPEAAFDVPESRLGSLKGEAPVEIVLWIDGEKTYAGKIREIGAVADPATRTYPVRARLEMPNPAPEVASSPAVRLGMSATVRVTSQETGMRLPASAIFQTPVPTTAQAGAQTTNTQIKAQPAVWRVGADNRISLVPVRLQAWEDGHARVTGLQAGTRVVTAGVHKLTAGEQILPVEKQP